MPAFLFMSLFYVTLFLSIFMLLGWMTFHRYHSRSLEKKLQKKFDDFQKNVLRADMQEFYHEMENYALLLEKRVNEYSNLTARVERAVQQAELKPQKNNTDFAPNANREKENAAAEHADETLSKEKKSAQNKNHISASKKNAAHEKPASAKAPNKKIKTAVQNSEIAISVSGRKASLPQSAIKNEKQNKEAKPIKSKVATKAVAKSENKKNSKIKPRAEKNNPPSPKKNKKNLNAEKKSGGKENPSPKNVRKKTPSPKAQVAEAKEEFLSPLRRSLSEYKENEDYITSEILPNESLQAQNNFAAQETSTLDLADVIQEYQQIKNILWNQEEFSSAENSSETETGIDWSSDWRNQSNRSEQTEKVISAHWQEEPHEAVPPKNDKLEPQAAGQDEKKSSWVGLVRGIGKAIKPLLTGDKKNENPPVISPQVLNQTQKKVTEADSDNMQIDWSSREFSGILAKQIIEEESKTVDALYSAQKPSGDETPKPRADIFDRQTENNHLEKLLARQKQNEFKNNFSFTKETSPKAILAPETQKEKNLRLAKDSFLPPIEEKKSDEKNMDYRQTHTYRMLESMSLSSQVRNKREEIDKENKAWEISLNKAKDGDEPLFATNHKDDLPAGNRLISKAVTPHEFSQLIANLQKGYHRADSLQKLLNSGFDIKEIEDLSGVSYSELNMIRAIYNLQ